jgi:SAM-dependent methyltransferase
MAKGNEDDAWLIRLLEIGPEDRVLEVGFGPGVAIELLAARATDGFVAGIDPSDVMVGQARSRNRSAVEQGRVDLREGTVASLPIPDASFTAALALHSVYFWPSIVAGLRELCPLLATPVTPGRSVRSTWSRGYSASCTTVTGAGQPRSSTTRRRCRWQGLACGPRRSLWP